MNNYIEKIISNKGRNIKIGLILGALYLLSGIRDFGSNSGSWYMTYQAPFTPAINHIQIGDLVLGAGLINTMEVAGLESQCTQYVGTRQLGQYDPATGVQKENVLVASDSCTGFYAELP